MVVAVGKWSMKLRFGGIDREEELIESVTTMRSSNLEYWDEGEGSVVGRGEWRKYFGYWQNKVLAKLTLPLVAQALWRKIIKGSSRQ